VCMEINQGLQQIIDEMKGMGRFLLPYTYPTVPLEEEKTVKILKQREILIDGYEVVVCYSKADYETHYLEILQIQGYSIPFLPFTLVCKLGRAFLGSDCLTLIEVIKSSRKLYCWTLSTDKVDGSCIDVPESEPCTFEGFNFSAMNPNSVNFY